MLSKIRLVALGLIACASIESVAQVVPAEEKAFTEFVAQSMQREVGDAPVSIKGPLTLSVGGLQANLDRIFNFCHSNSTACAPEVDHYVKGAAEFLKRQNAPIDKGAVRLVVRSDEYIRAAQSSLGSDAPMLQAKPFAGGLMCMAVEDTPRTIRPLTDHDLKKLNMSQDQLFALGTENLQANLPPLSDRAKPVASGQIGTVTGSLYESGRISLHFPWAKLADAQHGILIVALPTTDTILYVSEETPIAIDALRTLSTNIASRSPNPLAPKVLLKWTDERWQVLESR